MGGLSSSKYVRCGKELAQITWITFHTSFLSSPSRSFCPCTLEQGVHLIYRTPCTSALSKVTMSYLILKAWGYYTSWHELDLETFIFYIRIKLIHTCKPIKILSQSSEVNTVRSLEVDTSFSRNNEWMADKESINYLNTSLFTNRQSLQIVLNRKGP